MAGATTIRERYIRWVLQHHLLVLIAAAIVTVIFGIFAARLDVDSDLRRLLPENHPVVRSLATIEEAFGSTGSVNVVIKGGTRDDRHAFMDALARELEGHPLIKDVDDRLPSDFFTEHALYYLTDAEMEELDLRIQAWMHFEFCSQAPDNCLSAPDPEAHERLETFIQDKREEARRRTGFQDRYEREGIEAAVVLLHPIDSAASVEFTKQVTTQMRSTIAEIHGDPNAPWRQSGVTYNIVGPYVTKADAQAIIRKDTIRAGAFAVAGVLLVLYFLFRSARVVLVLIVPLACGVTWSLGATQLVLGHLNTMTSLISTVVMGAGIDAGIHVFVRVCREGRTKSDGEAIVAAFREIILPLIVASSTTVAAFLVMASSDFPAFREFGIIAALGVALCLAAMTTVLPSLIYLVGVAKEPPSRTGAWRLLSAIMARRPGTLLLVFTAVTALLGLGVRQIAFEYNGRALQSGQARRSTEADTHLISQIFGKDIHAGIVIRSSLEDTRAVLEQARRLHAQTVATGESRVAGFLAAPDLLPPADVDLDARAEEIDALLEPETVESLEEIASATSEEAHKETKLSPEDARLLLRMLEAEPFAIEDLPKVLLDKVRTEDGAYGIFAYPNFDAADMREGLAFTEETSRYLAGLEQSEGELFVGETTVYAAMFSMLAEEAPVVLGIAALCVAVLVYWQLRSLKQALLTLLPLALAFWWLVGIMGAFDIRFTLFNLPILPAILGMGVDNGVYLADRLRNPSIDDLFDPLQETGGAIMAAMTTTAIGFAAFLLADSGGVRGIGMVAVLGILLAGLCSVLVIPTVSVLVARWQHARKHRREQTR